MLSKLKSTQLLSYHTLKEMTNTTLVFEIEKRLQMPSRLFDPFVLDQTLDYQRRFVRTDLVLSYNSALHQLERKKFFLFSDCLAIAVPVPSSSSSAASLNVVKKNVARHDESVIEAIASETKNWKFERVLPLKEMIAVHRSTISFLDSRQLLSASQILTPSNFSLLLNQGKNKRKDKRKDQVTDQKKQNQSSRARS